MSLHEWPLTAYQRDVWTAAALNPESNQFTVSMWEKIDGDIDTDLLVRITKSVVRRNPCWRIRMNERDGVPYQWLSDTIPEVSVLDFSSEPDPAAACASWLKEASSGVFAITDSPLSKFAVLIESPTVTYWYGSGHHITSDGWTGRLLARQIFDEYARVAGEGESLDTGDSPSYLDFVAEEESYRASNRWSEDREFHHKQFSSTPPVLFSRTAPEERRSGATHVFSLDKSIMNRIRKERKVFPYLFAALGTYLTRIHRTEDVLIGIPLLNRNARQRNIHGQFSNTLPLRFSSASEGFSLQDHVTSIGDSLISLMRHSKIALGDVLQAMPGVRSGSRQLFDVTLSYLTADPVKVLPGAVSELTMTTQAHVHDALNICIYDSGEESDVRIVFDYAEDVFDENYPISSVAEHFKNLLVNGLQNSDVPWSAVDMLAPAERDELTHMMSRGPVVPYPDQATLHGLFEIQARTRPSETAVVDAFTGQSLTYAELNADANRVARTLRAEGVGRDDRVAVLMERGPLLLVALLGVLKAGSAYVPVDPGYPAERVKLLLADSRAKVVLVDEQMPERLAGTESVVRSIRDILQAEASGEPVDSLATSKDLAYVIYTSGSTGRPKGVMVEHHSVVNRLAWMQRAYPIDQGDILLQKTPVSFDVSVWELFWWAIQGAKLVLLPRDGQKDPKEILQTIRQHGVSTIHFVPSMLGPFLELLEDFPNLVEETSSLRYVFCSGEALPPARVEQFNTIFSSSTKRPALVNLYGPTEATVDVSCYECPADSGPVRRVPIGRPIDNTQLYVLGSRDELQPVGVPGELCIGGVQVARGYLDRPELTAEKFVDDPFTQGGRLYRTGDLARWLSDGTLEYLGRIDGQVKIRGNRVETGEVASALSSLTNVRDAVVVGRTLPGRSTHLVGYYEASSEIEAAEIRAHLAGSLPEFMIPTFFQRVERIPLTPNGKADVRALAELGSAVEADASGDPRNAAEAVLAEIWADVLQTERVGVHDDYFALGGDSILMLRVRALAEKRGLFFSLSDLVQNPTVAALARKARAVEGDSESALEPFDLVTDLDRAALGDAEDAFPLSRLQLGLLYHSRRHENSAMYKDVFRYTLAMPWDEPAFRVAVSRLVARHPVLRSSFDLASHSEPMQVIHPAVSGEFEVVDLRSHSDTEAESAVADHMEERRFHDYVFEQAPLYHLRVFVRPATVDLVLSFHHALLDGGSVANLLREVLQDYAHALGLGIDPVPTLALPSPALHIRNERQAADSDRTRRYWQERLAGAKVLHIDALAPYQTHPGNAAQIVRDVELPADLSARLRQVAGEHTLPLKSLLFAAHSLTLRMLTGTDDITTGMVTHGRPEQQDAERIAGLFLNTLPVRLNAAGESWIAVAREAFRQEQELHPHRLYPLSTIQEDFGTQVIETAFNHVHFHQLTQVMDLPDIELVDFRTREETNFALLVNSFIDPLSQNIHLRIDCDGSIFSPDQADVLARSLTQILHRMAEHPNETPDYTFLTTPPTYQDKSTEGASSVVERFFDVAARSPEAIALAMHERRWTYEQLADAARNVAQRLIETGTQPGARIGVAMDRSPEAIATILGTLMARAAVVPMDTDYPAERLVAMARQANVFRIITDEQHAHLAGDPELLLPAESITASTSMVRALLPPEPESTAYVLFTSGSTGTPKGVAMPHRALANLIAWQNRASSGGSTGGDTLQYAPVSFDVSFQEIFSTLCAGNTLHLVSEAERRDFPGLLRTIDAAGIERIYMPYVALQQLASTAVALDIAPKSLRVIISSGEQLRVTDEIRRFLGRLPGVLLENQYGPTETHVATRFTMTGDPADYPLLPPIGQPIDGEAVYVLDDRLQPVPPGVKGEIFVGGAGLAQGYEGRPDLTKERFLDRPFGPEGELIYRTGDLGVALPSGEIICLGRTDAQVKVRGFRVEPAEVELAITALAGKYPGIEGAAVVARHREGNDTFLAAFLLGDSAEVDLDDLKRELRAKLPDYMVPSQFAWLPGFPLTPSGKRDDEALRRIPLNAVPSGQFTAPRDEYERILADILGDLLQIPSVGVHDDFFELGGTSLTVMRLMMLIEQRYGPVIQLQDVIAEPTVEALAARLRRGNAVYAYDPLVAISPNGAKRPIFLVHPMGGNVLCYVRLARKFPGDQPLYALQAAGSTPGSEPVRTMPELVSSYISAIRRVQPHGPYTLGGWSFGGFVAFEMARQLKEQGEEVADLVLLDTTAARGKRVGGDDEDLLRWFFWELLLQKRGASSTMDHLPEELDTVDKKFDYMAGVAQELGVLPAGSSGAVVRRLFGVYAANWDLAINYFPDVAEFDLTLIRAEEPLPQSLRSMHDSMGSQYDDPTNGWSHMTKGRINVVTVPGNHLSIVEEPYVGKVAEAIYAAMGHRSIAGEIEGE
ncbi:amino acid adenylation domain-containing protein [Streptomyces yaanensis]|uniref:Amino acid adenylation domain-containing protein n=1 Tax=Streptomyces yaanensis TaxID=1142239 RepID=A0ABV7S8X3_9ACTN